MGTRGLHAYRYKGIYFIYYHQYDSYPSGLGVELVGEIPVDKEAFEKWLESCKEYYEKEYQTLQNSEDEGDDLGFYERPSASPPQNDIFIEWVYIYDLDRMAFSVDNAAHFRLDDVPRGEDGMAWVKFLALDGLGVRCLKPSTPACHVADMHPDIPVPEDGLLAYEINRPTLIDKSDLAQALLSSSSPSRDMAIAVVKTLICKFYGRLVSAFEHTADDKRFQRPAEFLLRICAPRFLTLDLSSKRGDRYYQGANSSNPTTVFYWFRGCLVLLVNKLDAKHFQAYVGLAATRILTKGPKNCTALLWSMEHVVVVEVRDKQVSHTEPIPILSAYGMDDAAFTQGLSVLAHYLRPTSNGTTNMDGTDSSEPQNSFSYAANETSKAPRLPFDILVEIMGFVDVFTYNTSFCQISKATRAIWLSHPRIGPYRVLSGQIPEDKKDLYHLSACKGDGPAIQIRLLYRGRYPDDDDDERSRSNSPELNLKNIMMCLPAVIEDRATMTSWFKSSDSGMYAVIDEPATDTASEVGD